MTREEYQRQQHLDNEQKQFEQQRTHERDYDQINHQDPRQQTYARPYDYYPEKRKHHYFRDFVICIVCILIGAGGCKLYVDHEANQSAQMPKTEIKRYSKKITNNNNTANAGSKSQNVKDLKSRMDQIQLSQADQQEALSKFNQINATDQAAVLAKLNSVEKSIPSNFLRRQVAQQALNQLGQNN